MEFLIFAAILILIAVILKWWMGADLESGMLGKGFLLIIIILVIVGLLSVFGLLGRFRISGAPTAPAVAALSASAATYL